jgi:hypothetical protein
VLFGRILSAAVRNVRVLTTPTADTRDQLAARLRAVADAYAEMAELPAWSLTDATLDARMAAALQARAAADEMVARIVAEADAAGVAARAGATSTRAWLIGRHQMSPRAATVALAQGRAMTPRTEQTRLAWARGEIDGDRAEAVAAALTNLSEQVPHQRMEAVEADLLAHARTLTLAGLRRLANRVVEAADPDQADRLLGERLAAQERRAYERAAFRGRKGADGVAAFSGRIPNLHYDMLKTALDAIASPRRDHLRDNPAGIDGAETAAGADGAEGVAAVGGAADAAQVGTERVPVPYATRLGQALCELAERLDADALPIAAGANATVVVTVDEPSLRDGVGAASLSTGDDLSVSEARRLACTANLLPMVLGGDSAVLDLGRSARLFDKSQRIALAHRDGGCVFPGCDRPPAWAEAHHVTPWAMGGKTDLDNGALLCGRNHRLIHHGEWQIRIAADRLPEVIPPERVDPQRRPLRHHRFRHRHRQRQRDRQRPRPGAGRPAT